jgi:hypothetical protein
VGANVAATIYGQILATTLVATLSEDGGISAGQLFLWFGVTMLVFWFAHLFAEAVAERVERDQPLEWSDVVAVARRERGEITSALPALAILGLGWAGVLTDEASVDLAIAAGIVALFGWGFVIARRSHLSPLRTVAAVAIIGTFGLVIVALKIFIH